VTSSGRVALVADSDQIPDSDEGGGQITLMTVHTAKGLEFPVVFVTGMEDGTFPHQRSLADPAELSEERRLAYVALTRARQRLYLTRAAVRTSWGTPQQLPGSRFIGEIPADVLEWRRERSAMETLFDDAGGGAPGEPWWRVRLGLVPRRFRRPVRTGPHREAGQLRLRLGHPTRRHPEPLAGGPRHARQLRARHRRRPRGGRGLHGGPHRLRGLGDQTTPAAVHAGGEALISTST
jgi:DNA helicase-2/ATP-dependent DNA helicase PcrA